MIVEEAFPNMTISLKSLTFNGDQGLSNRALLVDKRRKVPDSPIDPTPNSSINSLILREDFLIEEESFKYIMQKFQGLKELYLGFLWDLNGYT